MDFFSILAMVGGLSLFMYGMNTMGDGLSKLAGGKLAGILEKLTSKRIYAVILGMVVTAVIQSSSATTVMVVGFVNSGIMNLNQAVGIIIGANIGTTLTSWLLSLVGVEGGNFFMNLLKPSSLSPIMALIGILMIMSKKSQKSKDIGSIFIGFAILMFGMEMMSDAVKPLADDPNFTGILTRFSNPFLGVSMGAILTAIIQSSSASVGILQALCTTGVITYAVAVPIIMGQNIGTCFTAILSSVGANVNARRASFIHMYFNLIGTIIFMTAFYSYNGIVGFPFINDVVKASDVALIHSIFNVTCTIILYPMADWLVKLATWTVKDVDKSETEGKKLGLDERFLQQPSFAIQRSRAALEQMADHVSKSSELTSDLLSSFDGDKVKEVYSIEDQIDEYEDALASYLLKLSDKQLSTEDNNSMSLILHSIVDLERISDHCNNISENMENLHNKKHSIPEVTLKELAVLSSAVRQVVHYATNALKNEDYGIAIEIEPLEQVVDDLSKTIRQRHIQRLKNGYCSIETGLVIEDTLIDLERISDHCSNIAIAIIELKNENLDSHSYLLSLSKSDDSTFAQIYNAFKAEYYLDGKDDIVTKEN
ncbi:MAG: Na/Pi cotransporter family protein [Erysipelotrichaceae bacterium]|nr:Na/Pi cotransporter family protein [Erysipelotrichaceae bacterium]